MKCLALSQNTSWHVRFSFLDTCSNWKLVCLSLLGECQKQKPIIRGIILYLRSLETWHLVHWCERLLNGSGSVHCCFRRRCFENCLYYRCNIAAQVEWWHGCEFPSYNMVQHRRSLDITCCCEGCHSCLESGRLVDGSVWMEDVGAGKGVTLAFGEQV